MKKNHICIGSIVCGFILLSGCTQITDNDNPPAGVSFTEIRICDGPSENFSQMFITFSDVKLFSNKTSWISFLSEPKTVDLMYLHISNLTETLGLWNITIANYTKLWIVIDNATGVLSESGETIYFDVPSDILKIQHLFDFRKGDNTITLEINLDESIHIYSEDEEREYKLLPVLSELKLNYANGTQIRFQNHERIINYANGTEIRIQDENTLRNIIENRKPIIDVVVNGERRNTFQLKINESIILDASNTFDIDNDPLIFSWNFGDNTSGNGTIVTHSYSKEGTYQIRLTVSDSELEDIRIIMITVLKTGTPGKL